MVHNEVESLGENLPNLPALHSINCRYNKLTDAGVPKKIFTGNDLSIVVSIECVTIAYHVYSLHGCLPALV